MNQFDYDFKRNDAIVIDNLSFTVRLSDFRYLERAGKDTSRELGWSKLPTQNFKRYKDDDIRNKLIEDYSAQFNHVMTIRFREFSEKILGLKVGASRGVGLQGYSDTMRLYDSSGTVECGFIMVGGNADTVHFQISGTGCNYVFSHLKPFVLHFWLSKVLSVTRLSRIDLAYDDFDSIYTTSYAELAYKDDAFRSIKGGRVPQIDIRRPSRSGEIIGDTVYIGSRNSTVFWRIYDKSLEQGFSDCKWYRSEVELKKVTVDVLGSPAQYFAGICAFSASINLETGIYLNRTKKRVNLTLAGKMHWARKQCGKFIADLMDLYSGDEAAVVGLLIGDRGGKFGLPDTYRCLVNVP